VVADRLPRPVPVSWVKPDIFIFNLSGRVTRTYRTYPKGICPVCPAI